MERSHLKSKSSKFEDELKSEEDGEDDVEAVQHLGVGSRLVVVLHGEGQGVEHDRHEHRVLAHRRRGKGPQFVLQRVLRDVAPHRLGVQRELYAVPLKSKLTFRTRMEIKICSQLLSLAYILLGCKVFSPVEKK